LKIKEARESTSLAFRPNVFGRNRVNKENSSLYTFRIKADIRNKLEKMFGFKHSTIYPDFSGFPDFGTPKLKSYLNPK
jgi:glutaredoxin 2